MDNIEFNLLGNAIDSLEKSIDLLAWREEQTEARRIKQAVLSIAHGIELLLKARLREVHPSLVWENVDKYPSLSARTVGVDTAITRLINIGGVYLSKEDIHLVRELRDTRNAIEHFSWKTTRKKAYSLIGSSLAFAIFFAKQQFKYDFFGYRTKDEDTFYELISNSNDFEAAYTLRQKIYENQNEPEYVKCEFCNGIGLHVKTLTCKLCGSGGNFPGSLSDFDDDIPF